MTRRHKYGATPTTVDGIRFDSQGEATHWCNLQIRERVGEIRNLERQVKFPITISGKQVGKYCLIADFAYFENNERVVEDFKGYETKMSKFKRALVKAIYGVDVRLVTKP